MAHGRFDNPIIAALAGVKDFFRKQDLVDKYTDEIRLDGLTCLITGANSGLGYGIAIESAQKGAHVIMAGRSAIPEAGQRVAKATQSTTVDMEYLDLSSITSIHNFVDQLVAKDVHVDRLILNAGVALPKARKLENGQEEMFFVNYLANFILISLMLHNGVIGPTRTEEESRDNADRIIFISSDSHQGSSDVDYEEFGKYFDYGVSEGISYYSYYKLVLNTYATELSRRLNKNSITLATHVICPGPVNSKIAKEAPGWLQSVLGVIFYLFFKNPIKAARPVVYMATANEYGSCTNEYLHMFNQKRMDEKVYSKGAGMKLWNASQKLWDEMDDQSVGILE